MTLSQHGVTLGRLSLSPGALFAAALLLYFGPDPMYSACLTAAALHEAGHLLACLALRIPVRGLRLSLLGAVLDTDVRCRSGAEEAAVALAGPLGNLLLLPLALRRGEALLAAATLLLGLFNLLPIAPLDGSRALHGLLSLTGALDWADAWTARLSRWGQGLLLAPGLALGVLGNRSLLLVTLWLLLGQRGARGGSGVGRVGA